MDVPNSSDITRFWTKVDKSGDCWLWTAYRKPTGYGQFGFGGTIANGGKLLLSHRVSWMIAHGPIPDGMCVLHRCDNPPCVNPAHLFLGTKADNSADMVSKNRQPRNRGEAGNAKLTNEQILEIKAIIAKGTELRRVTARKFGVHQTTISRIASGTRRQYC